MRFFILFTFFIFMWVSGGEINTSNQWNEIYTAIKKGDKDSFKNLTKRKDFKVNETSEDHESFLHIAILYDRLKMAESLIRKGANVNQILDGETPLHLAISYGSQDMMKLLFKHGADVNKRSSDEENSIEVTIRRNDFKKAKLLIMDMGANVNAKNMDDATPLHYAGANGRLKIAKLLIEAGADKKAKNKVGMTPLDMAKINLHPRVERLFMDSKVKTFKRKKVKKRVSSSCKKVWI